MVDVRALTDVEVRDRTYLSGTLHDQAFMSEPLVLDFTTKDANTDDLPLVSRILAAYRYATSVFDGHGDSMWDVISEYSEDVQQTLQNGSIEVNTSILRHPANHNLLFGYDETNALHHQQHLKRDEKANEVWARRILHRLVKLTEAVGALRIWNPERPAYLDVTIEDILTRLDEAFGFKIEFPNPYPGEYGLKTSRGIVDHRTIIALYCAWRLTTLVNRTSSVLEIGAGVGRVAYYARKFGIVDYTIVDLPHTNAAQANFLGRVLDPSLLVLANEEDDKTKRDRIRIVGPHWFFSNSDRFDIVLNCDSLTEIDRLTAAAYLGEIAHRTATFVSINHEANDFKVCDLLVSARATPLCHLCFPFWLRPGYAEEIYFFKQG